MCYNEQKIKIFEVTFRYFLVSFGSPITVLFGSVLFGAFWALAGALSVLDLLLVTVRRGSAEALATARTGVEKPAHAQRCSVADITAPRKPFSHSSLSPRSLCVVRLVKSLFLLHKKRC